MTFAAASSATASPVVEPLDAAVLRQRDQVRVDEARRRDAADEERGPERPERRASGEPAEADDGRRPATASASAAAAATGPPIGSSPTSSGRSRSQRPSTGATTTTSTRRSRAAPRASPACEIESSADGDQEQLPGAEARLDERERQAAARVNQ